MTKAEWLALWRSIKSPQDVFRVLGGFRALQGDERVKREAPRKTMTRFDKTQGPMYYLGLQICKRMGQVGYPARIFQCFRDPKQQAREYAEGDSDAPPFMSPHQFYEAVDIIHETRGWPAEDDPFWDMLVTVVRNVEADFGVKLVSGKRDWGWDYAHVQLADWKAVRARLTGADGVPRVPTERELLERFKEVLPHVALNADQPNL